MKNFKLFFLLLLIISCNSDDISNDKFEQYTGHYKIVSFIADVAVDLNNDNITSTELTNEINSFDFNDLEIRPHDNLSNETKLIYFFFPKTWITFQYNSEPNGFVEFIPYGFGTRYEFENNSFILKNNNYIELSYIDNVESNKTVSINSDLTIIDDMHLELSLNKEYYDFNNDEWIMLNIKVVYEKK